MPVSLLTHSERERLQSIPKEILPGDINAFFTLSSNDIAVVRKQHSDYNRLGFALQLCLLRYLGFFPQNITDLPKELISYVATQVNVTADELSRYGKRNQTKTGDFLAIQAYLGFHKASLNDMHDLLGWLVERALEHDKPSLLLQQACEKLYRDKMIRPGITRLEKMVAEARSQAQKETFKRVSPLLTPDRKTLLDSLLVSDEKTHHTYHFQLSKGSVSNSAPSMLSCLDKLKFLREHNVDLWNLTLLTPNRLKYLAQIAKRSTNQALQRMPEQRRYPILLAFLNQALIEITDETIEIYDRCLWDCYNGAKNDLEAFKKEVYKSSNEKVKLLQEMGKLVLDPDITDQKLRESIFAYLPPEELKSVIEECGKIIRPTNDKYFDFLSTRYSYLRQFVPKFLESFAFQSNMKDDTLILAIDILRQMDANKQKKLPPDAPLDFLTDDWIQYVIGHDGKLSKRYYDLCALWELRSNLRAGNIWVENSRRYANPETYLIPKDKWEQLRSEVCKQMNVQENGAERLQKKKQELTELLVSAETFLTGKGDIRIENGKLVVPKLDKEDLPESAKKLQDLVTARLPQIEVTDLLIEVGGWVNLPEPFEHAGSSHPTSPEQFVYLHASVLAQAENLGLHQMAHIGHLSYEKLAWYTRWYIREETLKHAFTKIVNMQYHQWLSKFWGDGTLSSSDGQRLLTAGKNRLGARLPPYFGPRIILTIYSWTSSQFSQFGTKPIRPTSRDSTYVLDEILGNESELPLLNHTVDTGGFTETDFALFSLLGRGYWPRLRDIGDQYLYRLDKSIKYDNIEPLLKATLDEKFLLNNYDEILRVAGSLQLGFVTASLFISKLQARPQQNILTRALQEYGKLEKTIFILRYIQDPVFRRLINLQLNKGEQVHDLRQFIHFANEGKIRTHLEEDQINEASCLNLVVNAVILWNTVYMQAIIEQLRKEGYKINDDDLRHLGPARHEHINPYGHYTFDLQQELQRKGLRPLRRP